MRGRITTAEVRIRRGCQAFWHAGGAGGAHRPIGRRLVESERDLKHFSWNYAASQHYVVALVDATRVAKITPEAEG